MFNRKRKAPIKEIKQSADAADVRLRKQESHVNSITSWLQNRANQNGFGADFEYTLRPRGAK